MQYFSLDIETTGLDPVNCDVLQVAIVRDEINGTEQPAVNDLPYFETIIHHNTLLGDPYALAMNAELIRVISFQPPGWGDSVNYHGREVPMVKDPETMAAKALEWLGQYPRPWIVAGKNVAGFDLRFLPEELAKAFHYEAIEAGSVALGARADYWHRAAPPRLQELDTKNPHPHDALEDARAVVRVLRNYSSF
jgi:oligoribonuclease (3'-5' exoribonuclease)